MSARALQAFADPFRAASLRVRWSSDLLCGLCRCRHARVCIARHSQQGKGRPTGDRRTRRGRGAEHHACDRPGDRSGRISVAGARHFSGVQSGDSTLSANSLPQSHAIGHLVRAHGRPSAADQHAAYRRRKASGRARGPPANSRPEIRDIEPVCGAVRAGRYRLGQHAGERRRRRAQVQPVLYALRATPERSGQTRAALRPMADRRVRS